MSTRNVERELTALLHRHAEDAMNSTDTQAERERLYDVLDAKPTTNSRRLAVGAAIVAAAVAVAAVVWSFGGGDDRTVIPPTQQPDSGQAADEAVAQEFVAAYVEGDVQRAASFLAPSVEEFPDGRRAVERNSAWGIEYLLEPCTTLTEPTSDRLYVDCQFDMHLMSSREVGLEPFTGNNFSVVVEDGEVVSADITHPYETNGIQEHLEAVFGWVEENHPADAAFLDREESAVPRAEWQRWLRVWEKRLGDYVDAMTSEGNG